MQVIHKGLDALEISEKEKLDREFIKAVCKPVIWELVSENERKNKKYLSTLYSELQPHERLIIVYDFFSLDPSNEYRQNMCKFAKFMYKDYELD